MGSIPACAGEPAQEFQRVAVIDHRVYPRVCGGTGSPATLAAISGPLGSIPACAGEPSTMLHDPRTTEGEGLSPRVRGNQRHIDCHARVHYGRVYPRVCGGTSA